MLNNGYGAEAIWHDLAAPNRSGNFSINGVSYSEMKQYFNEATKNNHLDILLSPVWEETATEEQKNA